MRERELSEEKQGLSRMGARKRLTGEVVSNAMDKTVVVKVVRISEHPLYRKKIRKASRFSAHDENGIVQWGSGSD